MNSSTLVYSSMLYRPLFTFHQVLVAFVPLKNPKVPSDKLSMGGRARPSVRFLYITETGHEPPYLPTRSFTMPGSSESMMCRRASPNSS